MNSTAAGAAVLLSVQFDHLLPDYQDAALQVDIVPPQARSLTPPEPCECDELEDGSKWIVGNVV